MADETPEPELLTVAESAARLGVSVPRLRRFLAHPENAAQTRTETRQTRTGTRTAQMIPFPFLFSLEDLQTQKPSRHQRSGIGEREQEREHNENRNENAAREHGGEVAAPGTLPVAAYQRVIAEQAARIEDLRAALEHERQQTRGLADALQREQSLRLLTVSQAETQEGPQEATGGPETGASGKVGADAMPEKKPGLWARIWGRG